MKLELAKFIIEALKDMGGDEHDHPQLKEEYFYSGDEDPVAAVVMEHSLMDLLRAVALACEYSDSDPSNERINLLMGLAYLRTDSMGRNAIVLY